MHPLISYLLLGLLGPVVAIPYGLRNFSPAFVFISLSLMYVLSIPIIFLILQRIRLNILHKNKLLDKVALTMEKKREELIDKMEYIAEIFHKNFGEIGFQIGIVTFSFIFGPYWAALIAFTLRVDITRATMSIGAGSILSLIFWWYIIEYSSRTIDPMLFTLFFLFITIMMFIYGEIKENRAIKRVVDFAKKVEGEIIKKSDN